MLASPGLCGRRLNRCKGLSRCCPHTKPDYNIDEADITHALGVEKGPGNLGVSLNSPPFFKSVPGRFFSRKITRNSEFLPRLKPWVSFGGFYDLYIHLNRFLFYPKFYFYQTLPDISPPEDSLLRLWNMFKCEICKKTVPPSIPATRIVLKTRKVDYPFRKDANKFKKQGRTKITHDKGGSGFSIVGERLACPECAAKYSNGEP